MAPRVLASEKAAEAAHEMRAILRGDLRQQVAQLMALGQRLCDPGVWDGATALEFRQRTWPQAYGGLVRTAQTLDRVQLSSEEVVLNILAAGSGGGAPGPGPLMLAPGAFAGLHGAQLLTQQAWANARDGMTTWARPDTLADHVWGGPSRPGGPPHGPDFGVTTEGQYTRQATDFLQQASANGYQVKVDGRGNIRVYDPATNTFGAYNADGTTRTFYKPRTGAAYWNSQPGSPPTGSQLDDAVANARRIEAEARNAPGARIGALLDSPVGRGVSRVMGGLAVAGDVLTIANPSRNALGGASVEQTMAAANLGAMAITAAPVAELLAANAATDWIPGVGEVVMAGSALYLAGDFIYQNREAIGQALSWTGNETAHVAADVANGIASGFSHAWHGLFG